MRKRCSRGCVSYGLLAAVGAWPAAAARGCCGSGSVALPPPASGPDAPRWPRPCHSLLTAVVWRAEYSKPKRPVTAAVVSTRRRPAADAFDTGAPLPDPAPPAPGCQGGAATGCVGCIAAAGTAACREDARKRGAALLSAAAMERHEETLRSAASTARQRARPYSAHACTSRSCRRVTGASRPTPLGADVAGAAVEQAAGHRAKSAVRWREVPAQEDSAKLQGGGSDGTWNGKVGRPMVRHGERAGAGSGRAAGMMTALQATGRTRGVQTNVGRPGKEIGKKGRGGEKACAERALTQQSSHEAMMASLRGLVGV